MYTRLSTIPLAFRYALLSAFGFAVMSACVKLASIRAIPVLEIVAARSIVSLVLSYLVVRHKGLPLFGQRKGLLIARGSVGALALICVYYSVTTIPLAEATVLQYLHPMFTAVLAMLFLKERLHLSTLMCIALSFLGLIAIAQPPVIFGTQANPIALLSLTAALLGSFGSAVAYVLIRKLNETEDPSVIIFYFPLITLPLALVLLGDNFVMPSGWDWLILLLVGVFTQLGQIGLTKAMQTETASKATAYSYIQVLFSALLGWLIFSETPMLWTWVGTGLIILGALVNVFCSAKVR